MTDEKRECGTCTLCCKLLGVEEYKKPAGQWCGKCDRSGGGCKIQDRPERPRSCAEFNCLWLQGGLPEALRPDKTGVVVGVTRDSKSPVLYVDPGYPDAYKSGAMEVWFQGMLKAFPQVFVVIGQRRLMLRNEPAHVVMDEQP